MSLEDEVKKIWGLSGDPSEGSESLGASAKALSDYLEYREGWDRIKAGDLLDTLTLERIETCEAVAVFIKEHLIEALSSPHPYIREWGRLIAKEVDDA